MLASQKISPDKTLRVGEYIVGDDSASLVLQLRNGETVDCVRGEYQRLTSAHLQTEQVDVVVGDGCDLEIRNGDVFMHDGYMRVSAPWGDIRLADAKHDFAEVNETGNISRIQYELLDKGVTLTSTDSGR